MLSELSLAFISFINYFFIPIIGLKVYCKRHCLEWKLSSEVVYKYVLFCVLNLVLGRVVASAVEKVVMTTIVAESTKYTLIALVCTAVLPYFMEIIEKYLYIEVTIHRVERNEKKDED